MVNINQLFFKKPPQHLALLLLKYLGITSYRDKKEITIESMNKHNTLFKIQQEIPNLRTYYFPCKAKLFLDNINLKKCITITRQIIKLYGYDIISIERSVNNKKILFYHIIKKNDKEYITTKKSKKHKKEYIIIFN